MIRMIALVLIAVVCCTPCLAGSATQWLDDMIPGDLAQSSFGFGAWPGFQDGYDDLPPMTDLTQPGVYLLAFRSNGPGWAGPTGFYSSDVESPIPDGGSKTWWDIRFWAYNYTPRVGVGIGCSWTGSGTKPPAGYTGILTLDYVPASLNWTGPTEFRFDLTKTMGYPIPCPITDDPFNPENVTRMHLTVYTTPEPSSLAALGLALAGFGAGVVRRRRR